jgi:hypothetical protein
MGVRNQVLNAIRRLRKEKGCGCSEEELFQLLGDDVPISKIWDSLDALADDGFLYSSREPFDPVPSPYREYLVRSRARRFLQQALKRGKIIKPVRCEDCKGKVKKLELHAHHDDYHKPLQVRWLCVACHRRADLALAVNAREQARKRGRPRRRERTITTHVRMPEAVYDIYCRQAISGRKSLHSLLQAILIDNVSH